MNNNDVFSIDNSNSLVFALPCGRRRKCLLMGLGCMFAQGDNPNCVMGMESYDPKNEL